MENNFSFIMEALLALLLFVTIIYAVILNKKISSLRKNNLELQALSEHFIEATNKADSSIKKLKKASNDIASTLDEQIYQANIVKQELENLIEKSYDASEHFHQAQTSYQKKVGKSSLSGKLGIDSTESEKGVKDEGKQPLGLKGLEALVNSEIESRSKADKDPQNDKEEAARSEAEKELLKALRTLR